MVVQESGHSISHCFTNKIRMTNSILFGGRAMIGSSAKLFLRRHLFRNFMSATPVFCMMSAFKIPKSHRRQICTTFATFTQEGPSISSSDSVLHKSELVQSNAGSTPAAINSVINPSNPIGFDTKKSMADLETEGFTKEQSEAIVALIAEAIQEG